MRKFLVVLLILSVMGGIFAEEGTWGTLTAEAGLKTTIDFTVKSDGFFEDTEMFGSFDGAYFKASWSKNFGPWVLTLPLRAQPKYFGTDGNATFRYDQDDWYTSLWFQYGVGKRAYNDIIDGDFDADTTNGERAMKAGIETKYDNGTFGFTFKLDLLKGSSYTLSSPSANSEGLMGLFDTKFFDIKTAAIGGFYHFMDGASQLYVSRGGAYDTNWFRTSTIVLDPKIYSNFFEPNRIDTGFGDDFHDDYAGRWKEFHWENIANNGIAYRFFVMDTLSLGLAIVSNDGGLFSDNNPPFNNENNPDEVLGHAGSYLIQNFLKHPVFGVKYDGGALKVSAMVGLEPLSFEHSHRGGTNDMFFYLYAGGTFDITPEISVGADLTGMFGPDSAVGGDGNPVFNFGAGVNYAGSLINAGLTFKTIDFIQDTFAFGTDFNVGYAGTGPSVGLSGHVNGYLPKGSDKIFDIGLELNAGYTGLQLTEYFTLGITGMLGLEIEMVGATKDLATTFEVSPVLDWAVWKNGSIQFKYVLGSSDLNLKATSGGPKNPLLDTNEFTTTFKWKLP